MVNIRDFRTLLKRDLSENNFEDFFKRTKNYLKSSKLKDSICVTQKGRFSSISEDKRKGIITSEQEQMVRNQISYALLEIIDKIEQGDLISGSSQATSSKNSMNNVTIFGSGPIHIGDNGGGFSGYGNQPASSTVSNNDVDALEAFAKVVESGPGRFSSKASKLSAALKNAANYLEEKGGKDYRKVKSAMIYLAEDVADQSISEDDGFSLADDFLEELSAFYKTMNMVVGMEKLRQAAVIDGSSKEAIYKFLDRKAKGNKNLKLEIDELKADYKEMKTTNKKAALVWLRNQAKMNY